MILLFKDIFAIVYAWLFPAAVLWNAGSSIVSLSHRFGKIHTDWILSFLIFGEGYHKEHHIDPANPRFGKYDLGGFLIKILCPQTLAKRNIIPIRFENSGSYRRKKNAKLKQESV